MNYMTAIFSFFFLATSVGCNSQSQSNSTETTNEQNQSKTTVLSADDFEKGLNGEVILLDVRTQREINQGHIPNAVFMDIMEPGFEDRLETLDKSKPVYVYCRSGGRSANAAEIMQELGFSEIYELEGGIMQWTEQEKPIVQP